MEGLGTTGFWKIAEENRDRLAIADPDYNEISYGDLYKLVNQISHGLAAAGLEKGDHIATTLPNSIEQVALCLAAFQSEREGRNTERYEEQIRERGIRIAALLTPGAPARRYRLARNRTNHFEKQTDIHLPWCRRRQKWRRLPCAAAAAAAAVRRRGCPRLGRCAQPCALVLTAAAAAAAAPTATGEGSARHKTT